MALLTENILKSPVQFITGVGPKRAEILLNAGIRTVEELLYYLPRRYLDRSTVMKIAELTLDSGEVTIIGKVVRFGAVGARGSRQRFILYVADETGLVEAVFFQGVNYWSKFFKEGERVALSGRVTYYNKPQIMHPAVDRLNLEDGETFWNTGRIISLYSSSEEMKRYHLDSRGMRKIIRTALGKASEYIAEYLPEKILTERGLMPLKEAFEGAHFPNSMEDRDRAIRRFKYEELFFFQLMLANRHHQNSQPSGIQSDKVGELTKRFVGSLPFKYTSSQLEVLSEIRGDMESEKSMNRLLQGEVGSGKTVVALTAVVMAVESGYQAALMAPTEILAEQHYLTAKPLLEPLGIKVGLLKGYQRKDMRTDFLSKLASGEMNLAVGTHALIQEGVEFSNLGLAIIDEQHRFGVHQRYRLRSKGLSPDVLVMTATPIPRTLALTLYGDLDVSTIKEGPFPRNNISTRYETTRHLPRIYDYLRKEIARGHQAYIIYPLIEESEKVDLRAAESHYMQLKRGDFRKYNVGLLHGRMKSDEKEKVMKEFTEGRIQILMATTVVEVGVDVHNATFMIIENAERFGLAQLHQLRGRIGRSGDQSYCYLISDPPLSREARRRIRHLEESQDGFEIAEADLEIRGTGEFFGARQHGLPELRYTHPIADQELLQVARGDAFKLIERDPEMNDCPALYRRFCREYKDKVILADVG
ncbi:MAG: ATP-dependent DNA helicase RecG [candidate division Zixibacteria bacterium]|nr:ATP-dependent DNA helicase RecG [Candidatus Tariuqbacter arcticus]